MKKLYFLLILLSLQISAQHERCATDALLHAKLQSDPAFKARHEAIEKALLNNNQLQNKQATTPNVVVTIPVVVHILYKTTQQNISEAQINSQIAILNADFRKTNADFSTVVPAEFQPLGADLEIQFILAKRTPDGLATTGIERKSVPTTFDLNTEYYTAEGLEAWDTTKYLNIWVGQFASTSLLGFAYGPANHGAANDGLVIGFKFFGNVGTLQAPFNKGRTATHEIGHYFNLRHMWGAGAGATGVSCGVGNNSDLVADTPSTSEDYAGCPVYPDNTYACTPTDNGSMFMNYMDYTNDACMAFFTAGQKVRTTAAINGPRSSLLTSLGGISLGNEEFEIANSIKIYPNPSADFVNIKSGIAEINKIIILNSLGQVIESKILSGQESVFNVQNLSTGIYFFKIFGAEGKLLKTERFIKN